MKESQKKEAAEQYSFDRLAEPLPIVQLPADFSRFSSHDVEKESVQASITGPWIQHVQTLRQNSESELDVILLSAYIVWLYRLTYEEDIVIGIPAPFRITVTEIETFEQLVAEVKRRIAEISDRRYLPRTSEISHYPTIFTMGNVVCEEQSVPLIWNVHSASNDYYVDVQFNTKAFKQETMYRFIEHYRNILEAVVTQPFVRFREIDILSQQECTLYEKLNDTKRDFPADKTLPALFIEAAEKFPSHIAISSEKGQLTYAELHHKSDQIAHMLCDHGLKKGDFVALFMERSLETIVGLLGIMKAGGVYVPIDPDYPLARITYMLEDSRAAFIITKQQHISTLQGSIHSDERTACVLYLDDASLLPHRAVQISTYPEATDAAYMIYTSGSTGHPKGTVIRHRSAVNLLVYLRGPYECAPEDVFLQFASYSFDASIAETFSALLWGARLHLLSNVERVAIEEFANVAEKVQATGALALPTAFFKQLAAYLEDTSIRKLQTIKRIIVAGEALTGETIRLWQRRFGLATKIFNAYGPTECTVGTTIYLIEKEIPEDQVYIPIGKPYDNYETYIVDPNGKLCPIHVPGELYIGGVGLAKEYLHKPDKTADAFVPHLFSDAPDKYLYKSGDIVRLLADGNIEYVGRKDNQVKIRGHRIEIDEIEDVFAKQADVEHVAVVAKAGKDGNKRLVTYYSTGNMQPLDEKKMRQFLAQSLPGYMIPEQFIYLESMPIAPTGKIDRKLLTAREDKSTLLTRYEAKPKSETEKWIAQAWEKVLGIEGIGVADDFFDIGGHSLKIISILVLLKPTFPFLKIQDFFRYRTISALAQYVEQAAEREPVSSLSSNEEYEVKDLTEPPALTGAATGNWKIAKHVLVTGATGYLGAHIVHELLHETEVTVYCLVRVSEGTLPEQRLLDTWQFYFPDISLAAFRHRIIMVAGDLSKPDLGLSPEWRADLSEKIDAIIHCAADVRHFGDSSHFEAINVSGTALLLNIIRNKQNAHFHHISTVSVPEDLAASGQWDNFVKHGDFTYDVVLENEYSNSKLRAEAIVRTAMQQGVPATIYRVGNLVGCTKSGKFQRNIESNAFYRMIKAMLLLGIAPAANWYVDITPVDYASRAIVRLTGQPESVGRTFHICNSEQIHYTDFIAQVRALGYDITLLAPAEYRESLFRFDDLERNTEALELAIAQLEGDGAHDSEYRYVCKEAEKILLREGIRCPKPDHDLVQALLSYAVTVGYFPAAKELVSAR